jgi:hypothetical protein
VRHVEADAVQGDDAAEADAHVLAAEQRLLSIAPFDDSSSAAPSAAARDVGAL